MEAFLIDEQGNLIDKIVINESELPKENVVVEPYDYRFHKPKWNGTEWVEGATQEEIDAIMNPPHTPSQPTADERIEELERENTLLKAQNNVLTERTDFHEEVIAEIILTIAP